MRPFVVFASTLVLLACGATPSGRGPSNAQRASSNPTVDFLLTAAATDFRTQRPPHPVRFRKVRSGYLVTSDGVRQYRLCGEFLPAGDGGRAEWVAFATIKTSPYEQWLGASARGFCEDPAMTWDPDDLSSALLDRFSSLR